jgi:uncharacterized protein YukE
MGRQQGPLGPYNIADELLDVATSVWLCWSTNSVVHAPPTPDPRGHFEECSASKPDLIEDAATDVRTAYLGITGHLEELARARENLADWEGTAADNFKDYLTRAADALRNQHDVLGQFLDVLSLYQGLVERTRINLRELGYKLVEAVRSYRASQDAQSVEVVMQTLVWGAAGAATGGMAEVAEGATLLFPILASGSVNGMAGGLSTGLSTVIEGDDEDALYESFEQNVVRLEKDASGVSAEYQRVLNQLLEIFAKQSIDENVFVPPTLVSAPSLGPDAFHSMREPPKTEDAAKKSGQSITSPPPNAQQDGGRPAAIKSIKDALGG